MGTQRCWVAAKFRRTLRTKPWGKWGCRGCNRRVNGKCDSQRIDTSLCVADAIFAIYCAVVVGGIVISLQLAKDFRKRERT